MTGAQKTPGLRLGIDLKRGKPALISPTAAAPGGSKIRKNSKLWISDVTLKHMPKPAGKDAKEPANGAGWEGGGEKIDLSEHEHYVGFRMRIVQLQFFRLFYQVPEFKGLSPTDVSVLMAIDANPGVRPGQLTEALMIKRSNLSKLIVQIENAGLISRRNSSSDKRTFGLHLTAKGHTLAKKLVMAMRKHDRDASSGLSEHERLMMLGLLGKLSDDLRAKLALVDTD